MTSTSNKGNTILHLSSRRIDRPALSVASSRADSDKSASAHAFPSSFDHVQSPSSHSPFLCLPSRSRPQDKASTTAHAFLPNLSKDKVLCNEETQTALFLNPRPSLNLDAFNVRSLMQIGQQASLVRTLDSLAVDVCCVSENRIQDASTVLQIDAPNLSTKYFLRTSGDEHSKAAGLYGVSIVLNQRPEAALLDWIPVNSRLCAVRLEDAIHKNRQRKTKRCLFVIWAYTPTDFSSDDPKDMFYDQLTALINQSRCSDIVILAEDLNAQVGKLSSSEYFLGGRFARPSQRTDNGGRIPHFCAANRLFLSSTDFQRNSR